jgi:hypothetical protein
MTIENPVQGAVHSSLTFDRVEAIFLTSKSLIVHLISGGVSSPDRVFPL